MRHNAMAVGTLLLAVLVPLVLAVTLLARLAVLVAALVLLALVGWATGAEKPNLTFLYITINRDLEPILSPPFRTLAECRAAQRLAEPFTTPITSECFAVPVSKRATFVLTPVISSVILGTMDTTTSSRILDLLADACKRAKSDGLDAGVSWTWHRCMSADERLAFDLFLVKMGDSLAWQAGSPESRFRERVRRMVAAAA